MTAFDHLKCEVHSEWDEHLNLFVPLVEQDEQLLVLHRTYTSVYSTCGRLVVK